MDNQTLGLKISSLRKANNLTQLELALKMGVTDKAVSKWERNLSCPDIASISRLSEVLGVSVDELMDCKVGYNKEKGADDILDIVLNAVPLAMGVALFVLAVLREIDVYSGFSMAGIGLACHGIKQFIK